ncbi:MAG: hypothetical protein M0015_09220, partial [Betaproteobacteria bacterium]|nr:hypothetical protein [Betaproteobacteria bacterium]
RWSPSIKSSTAGNGIVEGTYNNAGSGCPAVAVSATPETCLWWDDLRRAGFVSGSGASNPFNAFSGLIGVQTGDSAGGQVLPAASGGGFAGLIVCSANIPDKVAIALDTQMDDGHIASGTVRGQLQSAPNPPVATTTQTPDYQETGTNTYLICKQI